MNPEVIDEANLVIKNVPKRRRVRVGDPDFEAPDGGWGWLIIVACGISNLCAFPIFQQYGFVFKEKFQMVGITHSQTVTILNLCIAFNTGIGLVNGPVFKRFTQRQVALFSASIVVLSLLTCIFCSSFWSYVIFFSILYGGGFGLMESANALAINTYFHKKRRVATGLSWTITAIGPAVCPYIVIALNEYFGMEGTLLIFGGIAMNSIVCSLLLQPVHWHTKFGSASSEAERLLANTEIAMVPPSEKGNDVTKFGSAIYSSQYFGNESGYEMNESGIPMNLRDKDGWYSQSRSQLGSKTSLCSERRAGKSVENSNSTRTSHDNLAHYSNGLEKLRISDEKNLLKSAAKELSKQEYYQNNQNNELNVNKKDEKIGFWREMYNDFEFDLLKDPVFVIIIVGLTMTNFVELNFGLLAPMILTEFNFEEQQMAVFQSLLAASDNVVRFFISFVADKIPVNNRYLYLIGITLMVAGKLVLIQCQTYSWGLVAAIVMGSGKALRTIFIILVVPSHVPLERLPAAYGLYYLASGIMFSVCGPIAGWIREAVGSYYITLHILHVFSYFTAVMWITQSLISRRVNRKQNKFNAPNT